MVEKQQVPAITAVSRKGTSDIQEVTLKRDLGVLGSFSIGFADVGADIYVALGLVLFFAMGVAPLALGIAALGYMFTALSYAGTGICHTQGRRSIDIRARGL